MAAKKKQQPILITDLRPVVRPISRTKRYKKFFKNNSKFVTAALVLVMVAVALILILVTRHTSSDQKDLSKVENEVGTLMILPKDEHPTLATVEDKTKLKDKFLAAKAENGDRVLIYTKNQLVIIYRPSINKIAAVGTVSGDPALAEAKGTTLTVLNGDNDQAKTQQIIGEIKTAYPDLKITDGGEANRKDFPYTIIIDNTNQKDNLLLALVNAVSGKRGIQPPSEDRAATDFLVIVGKD